MKPIRCIIGLHAGNVKPASQVPEDIDGYAAFHCSRCGAVIE